MVNGHKSAAHRPTDSQDAGTGKTYLGGDMHCLSASSFCSVMKKIMNLCRAIYYAWREGINLMSHTSLRVNEIVDIVNWYQHYSVY